MRYLILVTVLLFALPVAGQEGTNYCNDPAVNEKWERAQTEHPNDHLIVKLVTVRGALCSMLDQGKVDLETARFMWEQALADALLEQARADQEKRGLLQLFGTF